MRYVLSEACLSNLMSVILPGSDADAEFRARGEHELSLANLEHAGMNCF